MQLEKDPALEVAEGYGLLAKAFKRLKKREEDPVRRQCYAELARAYKKLRARAKEDDRPPPSQFVLPFETAEGYMGCQRVLWGLNFDTRLCEHVVKQTVRADRFKNRWLADPNARRGWRSISSIEFSHIFSMVQQFHSDCLGLFEKYKTMPEWLDKVGYVTPRQWDRRHFISNGGRLYRKMFLACALAEHKSRAPLRG